MSKHNKKEESIFDKMENMTGIPVMYLAIILAVVVVIVIIGILYMVGMLPQDVLNVLSSNDEGAIPALPAGPGKDELTPPLSSSQNMIMNGGNVKIFKKR